MQRVSDVLAHHAAALVDAARACAAPCESLEIEVRWGRAIAVAGEAPRFASGVPRHEYDRLMDAIRAPGAPAFARIAAALRIAAEPTLRHEMTRDDVCADGARHTWVLAGDAAPAWRETLRKTAVLAPQGVASTLRVAASVEHVVACAARGDAPPGAHGAAVAMQRRKERATLALLGGAFLLEATRVATTLYERGAARGDADYAYAYELEAEYVCSPGVVLTPANLAIVGRVFDGITAAVALVVAGPAPTPKSMPLLTSTPTPTPTPVPNGGGARMREHANGAAEHANGAAEHANGAAVANGGLPLLKRRRMAEPARQDVVRPLLAEAEAPPPLVEAAPATTSNNDARLLATPYVELLAHDSAEADGVRASVTRLCAAAAPRAQRAAVERSRRFAGAMPVALRRADLAALDVRRYFVGEKSGGVRLFLYARRRFLPEGGATADVYFIDRRFAVYRVDGAALLEALRLPELLLDGEFVEPLAASAGRGAPPHRRAFLAFDVLSDTPSCAHASVLASSTGAQSPSRLLLHERLERIALCVVAPLRAAEAAADVGALLPFTLLGKQLWPLRQLARLLARVRFDGAARDGGYARYADERRCHATDGLLLAPNERGVRPFTCGAAHARSGALLHAPMFKLKFAGLHSVDLTVRHTPLRLCCETPRGEVDFVVVGAGVSAGAGARATGGGAAGARTSGIFSDADAAALAGLAPGTVVECAYDTSRGTWRLGGARSKNEPNQLAVVLDALFADAEHIAPSELLALAQHATA